MTPTQPNTSDVLIDFITAFFVPMFLATSSGDVALARLAAIQMINAYRIRHQADLITVAQIVAFGFAALSSLSLSMADDVPLSLVLRLRGNANACNRSAEHNRRALQASHQASESAPALPPDPIAPRAPQAPSPANPPPTNTAPANAASMPPPAAPSPDQQRRAAWAAAFTQVAEECIAELPHLPPEEKKLASIRATALNSSASALLAGINDPAAIAHRQTPILKPQGV